jgi:phage anti-repressor protein/phage antirepressor YoqD-like protein|nr:MAG TPA: KilAC domain protein [Caudoviricetes sp.]
MSDLIKYLLPIVQMEDSVQAVMGRDLHKFLQIGAHYKDWFPRMAAYGFEEGTDYCLKNERSTPPAGMPSRPRLNHIVSLDMAKEIAMIQRSELGKQARRYFIEAEKQLQRKLRAEQNQTNPQSDMSRLEILELALATEKERLALEAENKVLQPKAEAFDALCDSEGLYTMAEAAKVLGIGRNSLFAQLRYSGIFISRGDDYNTPYQRYMKYFEVKQGYRIDPRTARKIAIRTTFVKTEGINFIRKTLGLQSGHPVESMADRLF